MLAPFLTYRPAKIYTNNKTMEIHYRHFTITCEILHRFTIIWIFNNNLNWKLVLYKLIQTCHIFLKWIKTKNSTWQTTYSEALNKRQANSTQTKYISKIPSKAHNDGLVESWHVYLRSFSSCTCSLTSFTPCWTSKWVRRLQWHWKCNRCTINFQNSHTKSIEII